MKPPILINHSRPLFLELLEKVAQGLDNVFSVHRQTLGDNVTVDNSLVVKKKHHLLCPACMDPRPLKGLAGPF
jgi:hypothetical protein